jgi:hypothetical protein
MYGTTKTGGAVEAYEDAQDPNGFVNCVFHCRTLCRDISIKIDDGSAIVNAMGAQKAKDYKCLG